MIEIIKNFFKKMVPGKKHQKRDIKTIILKTIKYFFLAILLMCIFVIFLFFYYTYDLPRPEKFSESQFIQSTKIYDRTGKILLYNVYGEEKREIVSFDKISDNIKHAVLAVEDARFYQHSGIDFEGVGRAILIDLKLQSASQGASTITQQLIRSTYLTNQKTLARKIREAVLSIELERRYSKDQIFDWYLNQIPYGQNAYGVESASQTYFGKSSSDVSLAEAATLAAIIQGPSYYSPYGSNKNKLLARKDFVLGRMKSEGYITDEEMTAAKNEKIVFLENKTSIKAPHFVMYVEKYLFEKYGEDFLKEKGLKVYTTLDWDLQSYAEDIIASRDEINKQFDAYNTALVVVDPRTGEILTLMGSKNYSDPAYPEGCDELAPGSCLFDPMYDVATMGLRQPGSSFKPFVYATAFKKGFTPDTVLWDARTEFNPNCDPNAWQIKDQYGLGCYNPQNYDGMYRGKITLRKALAGSLNLPAVKLLYLAGINDSLKTASDMGISTLTEPDRYGLSLVLGGGEVNLLELTSAYGVFATEGVKAPTVSILKIEDSNGNIIEENKKQSTKVLDTQVARQISSILSDNNARTYIFGANNTLYFPGYQVAAKTGTTQYFNDAWTMGYTPFAAVGVWVGNNDNSSTDKRTGIGLAAPIWRSIMEKLLSTHPVENFTAPAEITNRSPALLGKLDANDNNTILYYIDKKNPLGAAPQNPSDDPLYYFWQTGINNLLSGR
jgi:1A family penicillin-binding protein